MSTLSAANRSESCCFLCNVIVRTICICFSVASVAFRQTTQQFRKMNSTSKGREERSEATGSGIHAERQESSTRGIEGAQLEEHAGPPAIEPLSFAATATSSLPEKNVAIQQEQTGRVMKEGNLPRHRLTLPGMSCAQPWQPAFCSVALRLPIADWHSAVPLNLNASVNSDILL